MKIKRMKNAIILCIISVFLCFVALVGTTLAAGFYNSKTNSGNIISADNSVKVYAGDTLLNGKDVSLTAYDPNTSDDTLTVTIRLTKESTNNTAYDLYVVYTKADNTADGANVSVAESNLSEPVKVATSLSEPVKVATIAAEETDKSVTLVFTNNDTTNTKFGKIELSLKLATNQ